MLTAATVVIASTESACARLAGTARRTRASRARLTSVAPSAPTIWLARTTSLAMYRPALAAAAPDTAALPVARLKMGASRWTVVLARASLRITARLSATAPFATRTARSALELTAVLAPRGPRLWKCPSRWCSCRLCWLPRLATSRFKPRTDSQFHLSCSERGRERLSLLFIRSMT